MTRFNWLFGIWKEDENKNIAILHATWLLEQIALESTISFRTEKKRIIITLNRNCNGLFLTLLKTKKKEIIQSHTHAHAHKLTHKSTHTNWRFCKFILYKIITGSLASVKNIVICINYTYFFSCFVFPLRLSWMFGIETFFQDFTDIQTDKLISYCILIFSSIRFNSVPNIHSWLWILGVWLCFFAALSKDLTKHLTLPLGSCSYRMIIRSYDQFVQLNCLAHASNRKWMKEKQKKQNINKYKT